MSVYASFIFSKNYCLTFTALCWIYDLGEKKNVSFFVLWPRQRWFFVRSPMTFILAINLIFAPFILMDGTNTHSLKISKWNVIYWHRFNGRNRRRRRNNQFWLNAVTVATFKKCLSAGALFAFRPVTNYWQFVNNQFRTQWKKDKLI